MRVPDSEQCRARIAELRTQVGVADQEACGTTAVDRRPVFVGLTVWLGAAAASVTGYIVFWLLAYGPHRSQDGARMAAVFTVATVALIFAGWNFRVFRAARRAEAPQPAWTTIAVRELVVALSLAFSSYVGHRRLDPPWYVALLVVEAAATVLCYRVLLRGATAGTDGSDLTVRQSVWRSAAFAVLLAVTVALGSLLFTVTAALVVKLVMLGRGQAWS